MPQVLNLEIDDYITHPATGKSDLVNFSRSGMHYKYHLENPKETDAMSIGTIIHTVCLEPTKLRSQLVLQPESIKVRRGKEWEAFKTANEHKIILKKDDFDKVMGMYKAISNHPHYKQLLTNGKAEQTIIFKYGGIEMKSRPDYETDNHVVGVKSSTISIHPDNISRTIYNFKYHWSAALETYAVQQVAERPKTYVFLFVEQEPPHGVALYRVSEAAIELAWQEIDLQIEMFKECQKADVWPGYHIDIMPVDLPAWAYKKDIYN